ncbi:MAG: CDP-alcohol phosphatidyltransferase family protein [bacterium]
MSRHINRYMSLFVSRWLAPTPIRPNHISVFTFSLGILAGVLAAMGGMQNFLLAGVVFQINSVIDGCDGELARVRYEFSVLGEWLDTLSDDFSDVFFWAGLGWGASQTFAGPWGLPSNVWWWLGLAAVVGKVLTMAIYYRWLIANKRGDLLAFTWSFDDPTQATAMQKVLKHVKYFAKKDFIVFAAMLLGFLGWLPWILVPIAPGNVVVALSVLLQQRASTDAAG